MENNYTQMNCQYCNEPLVIDKENSTRKYCDDKCRFANSNAKRKNLTILGKEVFQEAYIPLPLVGESLSSVEASLPPEIISITLDEHYAIVDEYEDKIVEYSTKINEYVAEINEAYRGNQMFRDYIEEKKVERIELKKEMDDLKDELEELQSQYNKLDLEHTILVETNKLELQGIEIRAAQNKKSTFSEIVNVAKDKDAMMGIATLLKGIIGDKKVPVKE